MQVWILTFNRPKVLNRQISYFGQRGYDVCVFSNHPEVHVDEDNNKYIKQIVINTLSDKESNSYCARSWNNIFIKCFKTEDEAIFVQDDTAISGDVKPFIDSNRDKYDLIWCPAGDTFFYMKKSVLAKVGWFDERYLGCYCGDADFLKRCFMNYDKTRLSVNDSHDWGFAMNDIGIRSCFSSNRQDRELDTTYINQHHEIEGIVGVHTNSILDHSTNHFKAKWGTPGNGINGIGSMLLYLNPPLFPEIDWYPWFTKRYLKS